MFGPCHTDGNCCGAGSYCCAHNAPHEHPEWIDLAIDSHAAMQRKIDALTVERDRLLEVLRALVEAEGWDGDALENARAVLGDPEVLTEDQL